MLHVQIVLYDGFDLLDAVAPYEVFCAAALYARGAVNVELVAVEGKRSVPSGTSGIELAAAGKLDPERGGIVLIPGASGELAGDGPDTVPAILGRTAKTALPALVGRALEREDAIIATVCGGSLMLAMGGLLEGRHAVTNRLGMGMLEATGAVAVPARVVDDGNLVSGGGVTSGLDVALYLLERELGPRIACEVEQLFEFERRGTVWKAAGLSPAPDPATIPDEAEESGGTAAAGDRGGTQPSIFEGEWEAIVATPVGKLPVKLSIWTEEGGIAGTATQEDETVAFVDPVLHRDKLVWFMRITKPMRLQLKFEVTADGDRLTGFAKAGILPASKVSGTRISRSAATDGRQP